MDYAECERRTLAAFQEALFKAIPGARVNKLHDCVVVEVPESFKTSSTVTGRMGCSVPSPMKIAPGKQDVSIPPQPFIWKMANGCQVRIQDMADDHLANSIKLIRHLHAQGRLEAMNNIPTRGHGGPFRPAYMSYGLDKLVDKFKMHASLHVAYGGSPASYTWLTDEDICSRKPMFAHLLLEAIRRGL